MRIEKLFPQFKNNVWGGVKLKEKYGKDAQTHPVAESWELSFHKDGQTLLENGKTLSESVGEVELGSNVSSFSFFPTLIKFIDARENLSVQVHPSDDYALKNENSFGKTEMWYIVEAEDGAGIYLGFNRDVSDEEYRLAIKQNTLTELLNFYPVKEGDCYFIPSGTIHAIGAGCLICEIQQNSNLTYRVYDYGRKDKDGRERELHVDKALKVTSLKKYTPVKMQDYLGVSKYFTVKKHSVTQPIKLKTDGTTFNCITCVEGQGMIDRAEIKAGDSFFVPANFGEYTLEGNMQIIKTEIRKYYVGIDLGGTFIKGGIVDDLGRIIIKDKIPTETEKGEAVVAANVAKLTELLLAKVGMQSCDVEGVGMGVPGTIDSANGEVVYANNLNWEHFFIGDAVSKLTGLKVKIANDANAAALGETKFGCGKPYKSTVFITLGTGVGGGVIIDGKLFEGNRSAGAELGHSVIVAGGEQCTCGRKGCLEAYASATALIRDTKRAMQRDKTSAMWKEGIDNVTGKTAFDYYDEDENAKAVVDNYIEKLAVGIVNIANEFRPEAIMLGGGVCAQGERLLAPLKEYLRREIYAGEKGPEVKLLIAELGNDAGLLGAAALLF